MGVFYWDVGKVLQGTSSVTLEVAVSNALSNSYRWFFGSSTRNNYLKVQRYDVNNTLAINVAGESPYYSNSPALTDGLISAAVTYDGAQRRSYRDGARKNTTSVSQDYATGAAQAEYRIAQQNAGNGTVYHNIRLYNRALTAEEIAANYAVDAKRFGIS